MAGKFGLLGEVHEAITDVVMASMNQAASDTGKSMAFIKCQRAPITEGWKVQDSSTKAHAEGITELNGRLN